MEKQIVFIKVPINDNHIGVLDFYITPSGKRIWGQVYLEQSTCLWQCYEPKTDVVWYVTHALEEIELPSEEKIEQASNRYYFDLEEKREKARNFKGQIAGRHPDMLTSSEIFAQMSGFVDGANFILNHLKSNTNG